MNKEWVSLAKRLANDAKRNQKANSTILQMDGVTARKKHLDVEITWEDVYAILEEQDFRCKFSLLPLTPGYGKRGHKLYEPYHPLAPSLDRINNDIGYFKDNICVSVRFINLGFGGYKGLEQPILKTLGICK